MNFNPSGQINVRRDSDPKLIALKKPTDKNSANNSDGFSKNSKSRALPRLTSESVQPMNIEEEEDKDSDEFDFE